MFGVCWRGKPLSLIPYVQSWVEGFPTWQNECNLTEGIQPEAGLGLRSRRGNMRRKALVLVAFPSTPQLLLMTTIRYFKWTLESPFLFDLGICVTSSKLCSWQSDKRSTSPYEGLLTEVQHPKELARGPQILSHPCLWGPLMPSTQSLSGPIHRDQDWNLGCPHSVYTAVLWGSEALWHLGDPGW